MKFPDLWTENCADLLRAFNKEAVEYLLIGSMAESFHCPDLTCVTDMDLMVDSTPENARKVLSALCAVPGAVDPAKLSLDIERKLAEGGVYIPLFPRQGDVDVLTPPKGFVFRDAAGRSAEQLIRNFDIPVRVAAMCDLKTLDSLRQQSERQRPCSRGL